MADRSPDADRIADALRSDGFSVITSDLVALPERVARLTPWAVVIDIEHAHADAVVPR